ncbi:hypothetical protein GCM10011428_36700 [Streptomyces violaceus]
MAEDDLAADRDFVGAEAEGHGLDGQGLVDVGGEVEWADHEVHGGEPTGAFRLSPGCGLYVVARAHAAEPHIGNSPGPLGPVPLTPGQKSTLMKAPTSWKPTLVYALLAAVLKSFT